jgi:protein-S-isoprenylcysteine O-methyltransferase Ste14
VPGQPGGRLTNAQVIGISFGAVLVSVVVAVVLRYWVFHCIGRRRSVARRYGERKLLDFLHDDSVECNVIESKEDLYDT